MGFPERGTDRVRVKRVLAGKLADLEAVVNQELAALEGAGQTIRDVHFEFPPAADRHCSAFIVYNDEVGLDAD
jgi:hypothetical protein